MSAYIVDKNHIIYLVQASISARICDRHDRAIRWYPAEGADRHMTCTDSKQQVEVCNMLWAENLKSIRARYGDSHEGIDDAVTLYDYKEPHWLDFNPLQVISSCDCLEYQSCETGPEWFKSEACAFLNALRKKAINAVVGMDECKWGAPAPSSDPKPILLSDLVG